MISLFQGAVMESDRANNLTKHQRYWLEHVSRSQELNVSMASYARGEGISVTALRYWRKRLITLGVLPGNEPSSSFARVHMPIPVDSVCCRIRFPNGTIVELGESLAGMPLRQLLATVGQLS